jgi:hypothetical protein
MINVSSGGAGVTARPHHSTGNDRRSANEIRLDDGIEEVFRHQVAALFRKVAWIDVDRRVVIGDETILVHVRGALTLEVTAKALVQADGVSIAKLEG